MATNIEIVRLLIPDTDPDNPVFSDVEIQAYLTLYDENVYRAAAAAVYSQAAHMAKNMLSVRTDDLSIDASKSWEALRKHAQWLDGKAEAADEAFVVVFPTDTPWSGAVTWY